MRKMLQIGVVSLEVIATGTAFGQAAAPAAAASAPAAAPDGEAVMQRVTVTAQKREQTLQDVPISVSVTNADTIDKAHIVDLIDLQSVVPSLKVQQYNAVGQTNFIIRGFGNGAGNDGIESSVGVFVDGVYRSRTSSALDDLPEIERVEVLRGPQSTLFGKNVSAGAINIVTAKPQFKFGGSGSVASATTTGCRNAPRSPARWATPWPCACPPATTTATATSTTWSPAATWTTAIASRSAATCCGSRTPTSKRA